MKRTTFAGIGAAILGVGALICTIPRLAASIRAAVFDVKTLEALKCDDF